MLLYKILDATNSWAEQSATQAKLTLKMQNDEYTLCLDSVVH